MGRRHVDVGATCTWVGRRIRDHKDVRDVGQQRVGAERVGAWCAFNHRGEGKGRFRSGPRCHLCAVVGVHVRGGSFWRCCFLVQPMIALRKHAQGARMRRGARVSAAEAGITRGSTNGTKGAAEAVGAALAATATAVAVAPCKAKRGCGPAARGLSHLEPLVMFGHE